MRISKKIWPTLGLIIVAIIWGTGFIATKIAIDEGISTSLIMLIRFALASLILGISSREEIKRMKTKDLKMGIIAGGLLYIGFALQTLGLNYTTPSSNAFITATSVVMVPFFSSVILKEKPERKIYLAAFICLVGLAILAFGPSSSIRLGIGDSITLLCAVAFALHTVCMGKFARGMNSSLLTFLQITTAAVLSFLIFIIADRNITALVSLKGILASVYLAVFSTLIAYSIQTVCQKYVSPSKVSIIISTEALFGSIFSVMLGYEQLTRYLITGGLAIIISMAIIETDLIRQD